MLVRKIWARAESRQVERDNVESAPKALQGGAQKFVFVRHGDASGDMGNFATAMTFDGQVQRRAASGMVPISAVRGMLPRLGN